MVTLEFAAQIKMLKIVSYGLSVLEKDATGVHTRGECFLITFDAEPAGD